MLNTTLKPLKIGKYTIPIPIFQGGMGVGISWDNLAGSVSKTGAMGIISCVGTGYYQKSAFIQRAVKNRPFDTINFYSREALFEIFKIGEARPSASGSKTIILASWRVFALSAPSSIAEMPVKVILEESLAIP